MRRIFAEIAAVPAGWRWLAGHALAMTIFAALSGRLLAGRMPVSGLFTGVWLATGSAGLALAALGFAPGKLWAQLARSGGRTWIYAPCAGAVACLLGSSAQFLWKVSGSLTFVFVKILLHPFVSRIISDAATLTIGSPRFSVVIAPACSGLEGMGLMAVFGAVWLWFCRDELRFPRALLLIPAGVTLIWLLNGARIAALILIGNAGAPRVAAGGFHSQAGWMAFNLVALGLSAGIARVPGMAKNRTHAQRSAENPTAPYLMPFLMILAAAMLSRAAAAKFEWLYPLRFFAAAGAIWCYRRKYATLNWRAGWLAPLCGVVVFGLWMALDAISGAHPDNAIASGLAGWNLQARVLWLAFRTGAAVITVPIAEELAFRGFLIRRLIRADFESAAPRSFTLASVMISSLAFGLMHGDRWLAGTIAGLLYAAVYLRRGRIGDAVAAHATTNALLAGLVLAGGKWYLW